MLIVETAQAEDRELDYTEDPLVDLQPSSTAPASSDNVVTPSRPVCDIKKASDDCSVTSSSTPSRPLKGSTVESSRKVGDGGTPSKAKQHTETRAIGHVIEPPQRISPCQSAVNQSSEFVFIRCLVRPFTAGQLHKMIELNYGPVNDLWLNRIKSTSIVRLDSVETAKKCREGLDGSRWPSINPRLLQCEFGNELLFNWLQQNGDTCDAADPPQHILHGCTAADEATGDKTSTGKQQAASSRATTNKQDAGRLAKPDDKSDAKEPVKLLDDLFRKTAALPPLYFLPLTSTQATEQAEQRRKVKQTSATDPGRSRATRSPFTGPNPSTTAVKSSTSPLTTKKAAVVSTNNESLRGAKSSSTGVDSKRGRKTSPPPVGESNAADKKAPTATAGDNAKQLLAAKVHKAVADLVRRERSPFNSINGGRSANPEFNKRTSYDDDRRRGSKKTRLDDENDRRHDKSPRRRRSPDSRSWSPIGSGRRRNQVTPPRNKLSRR